jgi:hypothetical protein
MNISNLNVLKDRHKNKIGFVLGAGYSLNNFATPDILPLILQMIPNPFGQVFGKSLKDTLNW